MTPGPDDRLVHIAADAATATDAVEQLRRSHELAEPALRALFEVASRRLQSEVGLARRLLEVCAVLGPELGAPDLVPASWYLLARLTVNQGDPGAALDLIVAAKQRWFELGRPLEAFRTELGRMHVLDDQGYHAEAVAAAEALLVELDRFPAREALQEDVSEEDVSKEDAAFVSWIRAATLENLGVALSLTGHHERALAAYSAAEAIHETTGQVADVARLRGNRGVELIAIGQPLEAISTLESAAALFAETDDQVSRAMCWSHAVEAELLLGHYAESLERYGDARDILVDQGAWTELCRAEIRAVRAYLALGLVEEAETLAGTVSGRLDELGLVHDLSVADQLWAAAKLRAGDLPGALSLADRSITGAATVGDSPLEVRSLVTRSQILQAQGDRAAALGAAESALHLVATGEWPTEEFRAHLQMAQLADVGSVGRDDHIQRAWRLAETLALPHLRYPALLELGRQRSAQGRLDEARLSLLAAVDEVEQLRWLIPNDVFRMSFFEDRVAAHAELVSLLTKADEPADRLLAYDVAEASKARTLSDILAGGLTFGGSDPGRMPSGLRFDFSSATEWLSRAQRPGHIDQVIEYHVAGSELVAFVWSGGELHLVRELPTMGEVSDQIRTWELHRRRWQINNRIAARHSDQLVRSAVRALHGLWTMIFAPVSRFLDPSSPELLIIPHGSLHLVPFHALEGDGGPVGLEWTITLSASFAVADSMRRRADRHHGRRSALVLGVTDDSTPAVADEARAVAACFPDATLLLGAEATGDSLLSLAGHCDVLHLACHGVHRASNPMFSALHLADRSVSAREVLSLRLDQPLVVLSACESGRHAGPGSVDEAIGFARSFVAAGAEAVVVSLWLANDTVTRDLMVEFYRNLSHDLLPATALRKAQIVVAEHAPHPADWAPFVVHAAVPPLGGP